MKIEFIKETPIHYLVYMPHANEQELQEALDLFAENSLLRSMVKLLESGQAEDTDLQEIQKDINADNLTDEQKAKVQAVLEKFPDVLEEESYLYKVEMLSEFLDELVHAADQTLIQETSAEFIETVQTLKDILDKDIELSEKEQTDLWEAWSEITFFAKEKLNIFEYVEEL